MIIQWTKADIEGVTRAKNVPDLMIVPCKWIDGKAIKWQVSFEALYMYAYSYTTAKAWCQRFLDCDTI